MHSTKGYDETNYRWHIIKKKIDKFSEISADNLVVF